MLDAFIALTKQKVPRGLPRLADMQVVQSHIAHREADLGSARVWLMESLKDIYARADDKDPIGLDDRLRVRLTCAHAIKAAIETSDYTYRAAGVSGIFKGTAWERRFRDMHTLSQQIQARESHFETVGRIMLNGDPDGTFL